MFVIDRAGIVIYNGAIDDRRTAKPVTRSRRAISFAPR
jgi:hypothetical protein